MPDADETTDPPPPPGAPPDGRWELPIDPDLVAEDVPAALLHRGVPWRVLAAVAVGGVVGAVCRDALERGMAVRPGQFPAATFVVNVTGSLVLGILLVVVAERFPRRHLVRPLLGTGLIGAYTTFSTFAVEVAVLTRDGHALSALAYVVASPVAGVAAVTIGVLATRRALGVGR